MEESVFRAQAKPVAEETAVKPVFGVGGVVCPFPLLPQQTMEESVFRAQAKPL
jgi:hypothetical protein